MEDRARENAILRLSSALVEDDRTPFRRFSSVGLSQLVVSAAILTLLVVSSFKGEEQKCWKRIIIKNTQKKKRIARSQIRTDVSSGVQSTCGRGVLAATMCVVRDIQRFTAY